MSAIQTLRAAGLSLRASGEKLLVEPADRLTDELRSFIRQNKALILRELALPVPNLEARRQKVEGRLCADPALRYAFDVQGATPGAGGCCDVSVLLGVRNADGSVITGELNVPAERWDMAAFMAYWDAQGRPS